MLLSSLAYQPSTKVAMNQTTIRIAVITRFLCQYCLCCSVSCNRASPRLDRALVELRVAGADYTILAARIIRDVCRTAQKQKAPEDRRLLVAQQRAGLARFQHALVVVD